MSCYIIKDTKGITACYYKGCEIYKREFIKGSWSDSILMAENSRENFSVSYGSEDIVLYQNISGDICMLAKGKQPKVILRNISEQSPNIVIHSILNRQLRLIYNIVDKNNENKIVTQVQGEDKEWSKAEIIDSFVPFGSTMRLVELGQDMYILIYGKKMPEYQFGYREVSNYKISEFKMIYATGYNVTDFSYCITADALHFVFIQSMGFMQRLVYIKKDGRGTGKPLTLYEGLNIKKCLVGIVANKLCVWWTANRSLSQRISYTFGETFNKPEIVRGINSEELTKAIFVDKTKAEADKYIFNEVYVDKDRPYSTYFIEDLKESRRENKEVEKLKKELERIRQILESKEQS